MFYEQRYGAGVILLVVTPSFLWKWLLHIIQYFGFQK